MFSHTERNVADTVPLEQAGCQGQAGDKQGYTMDSNPTSLLSRSGRGAEGSGVFVSGVIDSHVA